jgi:hypothetical protein
LTLPRRTTFAAIIKPIRTEIEIRASATIPDARLTSHQT